MVSLRHLLLYIIYSQCGFLPWFLFFQLEVWDTAGIERFATLSASYYHNAAAAILCYSSVNRDSFNALPQHLLETIMHTKTVKIFLCSTKNDEKATHDAITDSDVAQFEVQCDAALSASFVTSSRDGTGVADMFHTIAEMLVSEDINKFRPKPPPEQYGDPAFKLDTKKSRGCCS